MTDNKQNKIELSEQTRQLFDAPWKVSEYCSGTVTVRTQKDFICRRTNDKKGRKYINLIVSIPELYEALKESAYEHCHACIEFSSEDGYVPDSSEFVEHGCPKKSETCFCCKWWDLLRKVKGNAR